MTFQKALIHMAALVFLLLLTAEEIQADPKPPPFIRIHVMANSDTPADQALKDKVRDRLIAVYGPKLLETGSLQEAQAYLRRHMAELEQTASLEIARAGFSYPARADFGVFDFPARSYGGQVYPAGSYEALRLVIGRGQGANWWCVMFPPLCFVDVSAGPSVTPSSDEVVMMEGSEAPDIVYTFKAAKWWRKIVRFFQRN